MLLNAGINWKELQVRMGHKSMLTTTDTCAELAPQRKLEVVSIYSTNLIESLNKEIKRQTKKKIFFLTRSLWNVT